jgi:glycosyltransferase involved in cell wall biosynthesis
MFRLKGEIMSKEQKIKPVKILYIFPSSQCWRFCVGQLDFMQKHGLHVAMCSSPGKELNLVAANDNISDVFEINSICRNISPFKDIVSIWKLFFLLKRYKPDIVISGMSKTGLLGGVAALFARIPIRIFQRRGVLPEFSSPFMNTIMYLCDWISCFVSTETWCICPSLVDYYQNRRLVPRKNISFLKGSSNGLNLRRFSYSSEYINEAKQIAIKYNITLNNKIIGFCGRINNEVKGINELVLAFEKIVCQYPETKLLLVGDFDDVWPLSESVQNLIDNHPNIIVTGHVSNPAPYLCLIDIFVFPSHREGFGNAPLEASAMGVPVIATKITGLIDAVVDKETGILIPVRDVQALIEAIRYYFENPDIAIQHGIKGGIRAAKDFCPHDIWNAYFNELVTLLKQKKITFIQNEVSEELALVDLEKYEQELREWLAVKAYKLRNMTIETATKLYQISLTDIENKLNNL